MRDEAGKLIYRKIQWYLALYLTVKVVLNQGDKVRFGELWTAEMPSRMRAKRALTCVATQETVQ